MGETGFPAPYLGPREVDRLVDPEGLVADIARILPAAVSPPRVSLTHRGTWFAAMPAAAEDVLAAKLVSLHPRNPSRGLPLVRGLLVLLDAETGEPLLAADAAAATGWRTAAATALALRLLGAPRGAALGVIGAGVQADYHLRVLRRLFSPSRVLVSSRSRARARRLALAHGGEVVERRRLLEESDIVVAATTAEEPVVEGRLLAWGALVASVGAPRPVRELDAETLLRAGCVLADTVEGVMEEAGDVDASMVDVVGLRGLLSGGEACRWREVRAYKSVGTAALDLAVAAHLYRRLRRGGPAPG